MTGFGSADGIVGDCNVTVEIRTVNHRFFNPSIKLAGVLSRWEGDVRECLRKRIARGHVAVVARAEHVAGTAPVINEQRFAEYVRILRSLGERHELGSRLDIATVLALPQVLNVAGEERERGAAADLVAIVERATDALMHMRRAEGERLAAMIIQRLDGVSRALDRIAARAPERLASYTERLRKSVRDLAAGAAVDQQRVAQEVALLADRIDISEELDRFRAHIAAFRDSVRGGGKDPVGKRLGFLLQEMVREANTAGSKAADAEILADVVLIKEELERIREQVENVE